MIYSEEDQVCGNCRNWDTDHMISVTVKDPHGPLGQVSYRRAPCAVNAVELDAGEGAFALLGPDSHCRCHQELFKPDDDFLAALAEREKPLEDVYGVTPGHDYPATLTPRHAA